MSIDRYFERRYHRQTYNCLAFSAEVWQDLTGTDIQKVLSNLLGGVDARRVTREQVRQFVRHEKPTDPCLVVMQRPKATPHVGVYLRGRVLHIQETGVEYQPLDVATRAFTSVRFYTCNK